MKAAVLQDVNDLRITNLADPSPAVDEVVIRVKACGVCATDVNMWRGTSNEGVFPFVPGHEWSGEIVEVGSAVRSLSVGDRVVAEICVSCGLCANCRDGMAPEACSNMDLFGFRPQSPGAMAEFHVAKESRLHTIPDNVSLEEAALLEPVWVGYSAIWQAGGGVGPHDRVIVFGCGPIGMLAMLSAKACGPQVIVVEPQPYRREMALALGSDIAIDPTAGDVAAQVRDHTSGRGGSLVIECSGSDNARAATLDVVTNEGTIVLIGLGGPRKIPIELDEAIFKGVTIAGSSADSRYIAKTLTFLSRKMADFERVITHRFPLDEVPQALELGAGKGESSKIMIKP